MSVKTKRKKNKLNKRKNFDPKVNQSDDNFEDTITNVADDDLKSIYYVDDEGSQIDMTKFERKKKKGKWFILFGIFVILLSAATYFGYRIFSSTNASGQAGEVTVNITAEEKVASGDMITLEVEYFNNKNVALTQADLELFYPAGFYFQNASKEDSGDNNRLWNLGEIPASTGGKIRITGQLVGSKEDIKDISAMLTFTPSNFSNEFQVSAKTSVLITSALVAVEVTAPNQVQSQEDFEYLVSFTNTSQATLNNIKLLVNYPQGFSFKSASIAPGANNAEWRLDKLDAQETQKLKISGSVDGKSGDTKEFQFQFGLVELDNSFNVQIEKTSLVLIINPEIELFISAPDLANPGAELPLNVTIKNTSELEIKDLIIQLKFQGALFSEEYYDFDEIAILAPNSSYELTYSPVLQESLSHQEAVPMQVEAKVLSAKVMGKDVSFANVAKVDIKPRGELKAEAWGRYFDENLKKVGTGPLPPAVGEKTTYQIVWNLQNSINNLSDLTVSTILPADVTWEKEANKGVEYSSATRTVTYKKDTFSAEKSETVYFLVSITPNKKDVDNLKVLTEETQVMATDAVTQDSLSDTLDRITTDLPQDEGAKNKGVILAD